MRHSARCLYHTGFIANRHELIDQARLPQNLSDEDLLLELWRLYATGAAGLIAGTFMWLVWDSVQQSIVGARDRMGFNGLYYTESNDTLLISARVNPLLDSLSRKAQPNPKSLVGWINGAPPLPGETFYEGVRSLNPGEVITFKRNSIETQTYWAVEPQALLSLPTDEDYAEVLRQLLFRVVKEHLPLSACAVAMSSGLDSTSVAAAMRAAGHPHKVIAFNIVNPEIAESDESHLASVAAQHLNLPIVFVRTDKHGPLSDAEGVRTPRDAPFEPPFREGWEVTYNEMSQRDLSVLFSGAGGGHLFDGDCWSFADGLMSGRWLELANHFRAYWPIRGIGPWSIARNLLLRPIAMTYFPWLRPSWNPRRAPVPWLAPRHDELYREYFKAWKTLPLALPGRRERFRLLSDPLVPWWFEHFNRHAADRGIDCRHPLLDHRLIEFAGSLPSTQTLRPPYTKTILRNAVKNHLPREIAFRRDVTTPRAIFDHSVKQEEAKVLRLMTGMRAAEMGFVDERILQRIFREDPTQRKYPPYFYTLMIEDWLRRYF